jgi:hypothetical protein
VALPEGYTYASTGRKISEKQAAALRSGREIGWEKARGNFGKLAAERWRDPEYRAQMIANNKKAFTGRERATTAKATVRPTLKDIAWAAGFIEGEGTFKRGTSMQVCAAQVNPEPLLRLLSLFGGTLTVHTEGDSRGRQRTQVWRVSGARGRGFAMTIYSLMSEKRKEQIRGALS